MLLNFSLQYFWKNSVVRNFVCNLFLQFFKNFWFNFLHKFFLRHKSVLNYFAFFLRKFCALKLAAWKPRGATVGGRRCEWDTETDRHTWSWVQAVGSTGRNHGTLRPDAPPPGCGEVFCLSPLAGPKAGRACHIFWARIVPKLLLTEHTFCSV